MVNGSSMEENVSALIQAVKDDDKPMAEKLFAECPQLDPMKDPKRHFEVIDYSDCPAQCGHRVENMEIVLSWNVFAQKTLTYCTS